MRNSLQKCGLLTLVVAGLWLVLALPAYWVAGAKGLQGLTFSAVLCLFPGWVVFLLAGRYCVAFRQGGVVLLASSARMLFVLAGALFVRTVRPDFGLREFYSWLVVFYSVTLLVETLLLVRREPS